MYSLFLVGIFVLVVDFISGRRGMGKEGKGKRNKLTKVIVEG
jgi:hypothetical protein